MGCRPSKQATSKVRASEHKESSRCLCSPRKTRKNHKCSSGGNSGRNSGSNGKSAVRQCFSNSHRPGSSKSADLDFPAFSTTSAVYRTSASRTSKITLRLSCDGSTLEIEQCDYDLEKVRGEGESKPRPWNSAPNLTKLRSSKSRLFMDSYIPIQHSTSGWSPHFIDASYSRRGFTRVPVLVSTPDESLCSSEKMSGHQSSVVALCANNGCRQKARIGHALESSTFPAKTFGKTSLSTSQTSSAFSSGDERRPLLLDILKESHKRTGVEGNINKAASPASCQASSSIDNVSPASCQASSSLDNDGSASCQTGNSLDNDGSASCQTGNSLDNMISALECSLEGVQHVTRDSKSGPPCSLESKASDSRDHNGETWTCTCEPPSFGETYDLKLIPVKVISSLIAGEGHEVAGATQHDDLGLTTSDPEIYYFRVHSQESELTKNRDTSTRTCVHQDLAVGSCCPTTTNKLTSTYIQPNDTPWNGQRGSSSGLSVTGEQRKKAALRSSSDVPPHTCHCCLPLPDPTDGDPCQAHRKRLSDVRSDCWSQSVSCSQALVLPATCSRQCGFRSRHFGESAQGSTICCGTGEASGGMGPRSVLETADWTLKESRAALQQQEEERNGELESGCGQLLVEPSFSRVSAADCAVSRQRSRQNGKCMTRSTRDRETEEDRQVGVNSDHTSQQVVEWAQIADGNDENSSIDLHTDERITRWRFCFDGAADHMTEASLPIDRRADHMPGESLSIDDHTTETSLLVDDEWIGHAGSRVATTCSCFGDVQFREEMWGELNAGERHEQFTVHEDAGYLVALLCPSCDTLVSSLNSSSAFSLDLELPAENCTSLSADTSDNEGSYSGLDEFIRLDAKMSEHAGLDPDLHKINPAVELAAAPRVTETIVCPRLEMADVGVASKWPVDMQPYRAMTVERRGRMDGQFMCACLSGPLELVHHSHVISSAGDWGCPLWNETNLITRTSNVIHGNSPHNGLANEHENSGSTVSLSQDLARDSLASTRATDTVRQNDGRQMCTLDSHIDLDGIGLCPSGLCFIGNIVEGANHNQLGQTGGVLIECDTGGHHVSNSVAETKINSWDRKPSDTNWTSSRAINNLYHLTALCEKLLERRISDEAPSSVTDTDKPGSRTEPFSVSDGGLEHKVAANAWSPETAPGPPLDHSVVADSGEIVVDDVADLLHRQSDCDSYGELGLSLHPPIERRCHTCSDQGVSCSVSCSDVSPRVKFVVSSECHGSEVQVAGQDAETTLTKVDVAWIGAVAMDCSNSVSTNRLGHRRPLTGLADLAEPLDTTEVEGCTCDLTGRSKDSPPREKPRHLTGSACQGCTFGPLTVGGSVSLGVANNYQTRDLGKSAKCRDHPVSQPLSVSQLGTNRWRGDNCSQNQAHHVPRNNVLSLVRYFEKAPYIRHVNKQ